MGMTKAGMEAILMSFSFLVFFGYNFWLMILRPKLTKWCRRKNTHVRDFYAAGKVRFLVCWVACCGGGQDLSAARGVGAFLVSAAATKVASSHPYRQPPAPSPSPRHNTPTRPKHQLGRSIFSETCASDSKDAILAVQQARNAMTASTYLATVSSLLATAGALERVGFEV